MSDQNKQLFRRLVTEVMNNGRVDVIDELYDPRLAKAAHRWIEAFSGMHTGVWLDHPPTNRRFTAVAEAYFFRIQDGRITRAWGIEDVPKRLEQLGL